MLPWSDTPAETETRFAVGSTVYSGDCRGTVVTVDADKATMGVTYPIDAPYLRGAMPWD